jgi:hypothetical protein
MLDRQYRLGNKQVPVYVNDTFPSYPLYEIPNPSQHAAKILKRNNFTWTVENIKEAAECFRIPTGTKFLLFMPEIFFLDELLEHDIFRVKRNSPILGEQVVTGVKPCCPWCKTTVVWSSNVGSAKIRMMLHGRVCTLMLSSLLFVDAHTGDTAKTSTDGHPKKNKTGIQEIWCRATELASDHSFVIWNKECFLQFPANIRAKFSRHAYGLAEDDKPRTLPSPQVALEVLNVKNTFRGMQDWFRQAFELREEHAVADHQDFVERIAKVTQPTSLLSVAPTVTTDD